MGIGLGGIKVPGAVQAAPSTANKPPELPGEFYAQLAEMSRVKKLVNAYKAAPNSYSEGEALQIQQLAIGAGIPMEIQSSAGARWGKGLLSMLDTATFGLLVPDELYAPVNDAERKAVAMGSVGGMLLPWGGPFRLAGAASKGLRGITGASKAIKNPAMKGFMEGLKNPFGVGKVMPGFGKATTSAAKATTKAAVKEAPRIGKNFGKGMNSIIKQNKKDFWKVVNAAKTPAAKRTAAKNWIFKNMNKADRTGKGMGPRVEGWLKKKFPDKVKKVEPLLLGPGAKRIGGGSTNAGGNVIIAGPGGGSAAAAGTSSATKKVIAANKARKLKANAKNAKFKDVGATKKGNKAVIESIKTKIKGKKLSPKGYKKVAGKKSLKIKLSKKERVFLMSKIPQQTWLKIKRGTPVGSARDIKLINWAKSSGLL